MDVSPAVRSGAFYQSPSYEGRATGATHEPLSTWKQGVDEAVERG